MTAVGQDSLQTRRTLTVDGKDYAYYSLPAAGEALGDISRLPFSMKVLFENLLRFEDGVTVTHDDLAAMVQWASDRRSDREIAYRPARVLMQDFTGVPCVVDLAAMRDAMTRLGGDPAKINPQVPVDLVIDHSVMVDEFGTPQAFTDNMDLEYKRNIERYEFLRWGSSALKGFRVVPPGTGICHQVNLEYLAKLRHGRARRPTAASSPIPTRVVGTDSAHHDDQRPRRARLGRRRHRGGGGAARSAHQRCSSLEVIGFQALHGDAEAPACTATDLVLTVTQMLRARRASSESFVEFFGAGHRRASTLPDRATIANMAPEYGATMRLFPRRCQATIKYMQVHGAIEAHQIARSSRPTGASRACSTTSDRDRSEVHGRARARPLHRRALARGAEAAAGSRGAPRPDEDEAFRRPRSARWATRQRRSTSRPARRRATRSPRTARSFDMGDGDGRHRGHHQSCTNTSNPAVIDGRGSPREARRVAKGLEEQAVGEDQRSRRGQQGRDATTSRNRSCSDVRALHPRLRPRRLRLHDVHRQLGAAAPTPCQRGRSPRTISSSVERAQSGNRNFEGRVSPDVTRMNYPRVAAARGRVRAHGRHGATSTSSHRSDRDERTTAGPVYPASDIWPSPDQEVQRGAA